MVELPQVWCGGLTHTPGDLDSPSPTRVVIFSFHYTQPFRVTKISSGNAKPYDCITMNARINVLNLHNTSKYVISMAFIRLEVEFV